MTVNKTDRDPGSEIKQLAVLIKPFIDRIKPELILCYGIRSLKRQRWSAFDRSPVTSTIREYDLLIVTSIDQKLTAQEVEYRIGSLLTNSESRFNFVLHQVNGVVDGLRSGSPFFSVVRKYGRVVYDRNGLWQSLRMLDSAVDLVTAQSFADHHFSIAASCLKGAHHLITNESYPLAFFMLHQCVEHGCCSIIYSRLGYRPTTHRLSKLLQLTANFSYELNAILKGIAGEEEQAFAFLFRSYIDSRYDPDFKPTRGDAEIVYFRVNRLLQEITTHLDHSPLSELLSSEPGVSEDLPKIPYRAIRAVFSDKILRVAHSPGKKARPVAGRLSRARPVAMYSYFFHCGIATLDKHPAPCASGGLPVKMADFVRA